MREINLPSTGLTYDGHHGISGANGRTSEAEALLVVERLVQFNLAGPERVPALYGSGVRYRGEAECEAFMPATECLRRGHADAVELVAWRCAELRQSGEDIGATAVITREPRGDGLGYRYYTAKVLRSGGTTEDVVYPLHHPRTSKVAPSAAQ